MKVKQLEQRFSVPGVTFDEQVGLIRVKAQSTVATGELYLHGAHCAAWQPAGQAPVLWMSQLSNFHADKPIRGGVPICFPWFGPNASNKSLPAHGSARLQPWDLADVETDATGAVCLKCVTRIEPFDLEYKVHFGKKLTLSLTTLLPSTHKSPEQFEDALHTYFSISDIHQVTISGLEQIAYIDKVDHAKDIPATSAVIQFTGETDRIYLDTLDTCVLHDPGWNRRIVVHKSGSRSTIVWNPWVDKSARMPDFGNDEWPGMVCIETANVGPLAIQLQPGEQHTTTAIIEVA